MEAVARVSDIKPEVAWAWPEITTILAWRLAPNGWRMDISDVNALPMERALLEDRGTDQIRFSWIGLREAQERADKNSQLFEKPSVNKLQGDWQKVGCILLWKFARDGITITERDRAAVPGHLILLQEGKLRDLFSGKIPDVHFSYMSRADAKRIQDERRRRDEGPVRII